MKIKTLVTIMMVLGVVFIASSVCLGQEAKMEEPLIVEDAVICQDVVDRTPVESGFVFSNDIGKVYCFSRVVGAKTDTQITHNWYFNDVQVASVPLNVRSNNWRTYSSKKVMPEYKGNWKVEIVAQDGQVLKQLTFTIE
ncbi:MAG: DUF2914 domain-containing protein [Deltaproteobacteria bacterium]|nr:DUF2914 domain-containing protein [Deltaproteobacteria bacterium]